MDGKQTELTSRQFSNLPFFTFSECYSNIEKVVEKFGAKDGAKMAQGSLTESYHGHTVICGLLATWLADLKASTSSSTADSGKIEDNSVTAADEVRDITQNVITGNIKDAFDKTRGDEIMTRMSKAEAWYIDDMIESPRWRKLLIDLATTNKDSVLLKYCIRRISDHGHHRELAKRIKMTDDFSVYNSTLKAEFGAIGNLLGSVSADAESSMDLSEIVEDIKRMGTSASFTYLYAVEVSKDSNDRALKPPSFLISFIAAANPCGESKTRSHTQ